MRFVSPCRNAFWLARFFPDVERGPVLLRALRRFAAICPFARHRQSGRLPTSDKTWHIVVVEDSIGCLLQLLRKNLPIVRNATQRHAQRHRSSYSITLSAVARRFSGTLIEGMPHRSKLAQETSRPFRAQGKRV
jgi:hypothetical protein